jgi:segregation and condensation protein B
MGQNNLTVDRQSIKLLLESLLFVAAEPVTIDQLTTTLGVEEEVVEETLDRLEAECAGRGIRLQRQGRQLQWVTAPEAAPYVERFLGLQVSKRLSTAALETLAIVAYRQPITRVEIEAIRGVNSDGVLRTLLGKGLIEEAGRLEQVGRPIIYGTTFQFLQYFGLSSLGELPALEEAEP